MRFPSQVSKRERYLLIILSAVAFVVLNVFLFQFLWSYSSELSAQIQMEKSETEILKAQMQDMAKLKARDEWLVRQQTPMPAQDRANEQLLSKVQAAARGDVVLQRHDFQGFQDGGHYKGMSLSFTAKTEWEAFIRFLYNLHLVSNNVTFTLLEIKADRQDPSKLIVEARITDLYQP